MTPTAATKSLFVALLRSAREVVNIQFSCLYEVTLDGPGDSLLIETETKNAARSWEDESVFLPFGGVAGART